MGENEHNINEIKRLAALNNYNILDTASEVAFDTITKLAAIICETSISLISFVDESRVWFKSKVGLDASEIPKEGSFCSHAIQNNTFVEVEDALNDTRFKDCDLVTGAPFIRFYAGHPLIDHQGFVLGNLCVIDSEPKLLTLAQKECLSVLAQEVIAKIADRRRREELEQFERLFQLSEDLVCIADSKGFFLKVNPAFTTVLGWPAEHLLTNTFIDLIHPDDAELMRTACAQLAEGLSLSNFLCRFQTVSGSYRILQWTATPEPRTQLNYAIARDVTHLQQIDEQLQRSEKKLRVFFEHSQGLMCTHDLRGKFLSVNNAGAEILGFTVPEILKLGLFDIIPEANHPALHTYFETIASQGSASGEMLTVAKDGTTHIWRYNNVLENATQQDARYVIGNAIDVTEKHKLEKDLKRTKQFLEQTNKVARVGGWELNLLQQKLYWSAVTREIHGVDAQYVPTLQDAINFYKTEESRATIRKAVSLAIEQGKPFDVELEIVSVDKTEKWVRAIGGAEFKEGICVCVFGTFQDITDKKVVELELSASKKVFNDILDAALTICIISYDTNGIIQVFNKGAEKMLGYTAEEVIGLQSAALLHVAQEIENRSIELSSAYGEQISGFRVFVHKSEMDGAEQHEWTYLRKDGSQLNVSLMVTTIRDAENSITGYLSIAKDITERKKAEKALLIEQSRLKAFVEHAPAAVAMVDKNMRYLAVSERWLDEYKLTDRNIVGKSHYDVFPNISAEWKEIHQQCLEGAVLQSEEDVWRPEGWKNDQHLRWEVRPWYHFDNTIGGLMIFTQDITQACLQRDELKRAKERAEEASEAKSEFLSNMSHEIRTPLNGIIGFTDLVLKTELNDTQKHYLSIVNQSGNALLGIINDILDFSKIEAGKLELDTEKCDLYDIASQSVAIITYEAQQKQLELLLNISPQLPRFIYGDQIRIKQILVNLLGNATKFTSKGEIELNIRPLHEENGITQIRFSVRDTGIGIQADKQNKIFEAFSQEDGSTTKKYGGTGLGLTISNNLLALMNSKLHLTSNPGTGSNFYFDISLRTEVGEKIVNDEFGDFGEILIVEDNAHSRDILKKMLHYKHIKTTEATNGYEALQQLAAGKLYSAIFMDYHMPLMDGLETVRQIRSVFSAQPINNIPIFLYSSSNDEKLTNECASLGIAKLLLKPIRIDDLYASLAEIQQNNQALTTKPPLPNSFIDESFIILLVEDNDINMFLAKTILKKVTPKAKIIECKNGAEAVAYCTTQVPNIVFMDVQMPVMNGYETTKNLRSLKLLTHTPIIALTAGNVKGEREKCLEAGMNDFIVKPIKEADLAQAFSKWTAKPQEQHEPIVEPQTNDITTHFNVEKFKIKVNGDEEIVLEFLTMINAEFNQVITNIALCVENKNIDQLHALAHKLHGTALSMEMDTLSNLANQLEQVTIWDDQVVKTITQQILQEFNVVRAISEGITAR